LLREVFKIHPLAIEDAQEFNQRPKIEDYDDFVSLVAYGASQLDQPLVEVHAFYAGHRGRGRHRAARPVQETRVDVSRGTGSSGPGWVRIGNLSYGRLGLAEKRGADADGRS